MDLTSSYNYYVTLKMKQMVGEEASPVVQWLRCQAPKAGDLSSIPGQGAICHLLQLRVCTSQLRVCMLQPKILHVLGHSVVADSL